MSPFPQASPPPAFPEVESPHTDRYALLGLGEYRCQGCGCAYPTLGTAGICERDHQGAARRLAASLELYADTWPEPT